MNTLIPSTIRVLGTDTDSKLIIWTTDQRRIHRIRTIEELTRARIIQLCGLRAFEEVCQEVYDLYGPKQSPIPLIKDHIAEESRRDFFSDKQIMGQGIWRIPGTENLVIISGNRALQFNGGKSWTILNSPILGSKLLDLTGNQWVDPSLVRQEAMELSIGTVDQIWEELVSCLSAWKFKGENDHLLVAGLIVATGIQATLDFRPQTWVVGSTNTGKTALKTFLATLWPYADQFENESSEAAVRQTVRLAALPILMDEQEAWHGRARLIKTLRSATRGGTIRKGSTTGEALEFRMQHISWSFSIEFNLPRAADRNRFLVLELEKQPSFKMPDLSRVGELGLKLVACGVVRANAIRDAWRKLTSDDSLSRYGRQLEVYALPIAVYSAMTNRPVDELIQTIMAVQMADMENEYITDEQDLIQTILMSSAPGDRTPLSYYLARSKQRTGDSTLENMGIRKLGEKVFFATELLKKTLLSGTKWADANIKLMLGRIEGATNCKQRVNGMNLNGVLIPLRTLLPIEILAVQANPELPAANKPTGFTISAKPALPYLDDTDDVDLESMIKFVQQDQGGLQ